MIAKALERRIVADKCIPRERAQERLRTGAFPASRVLPAVRRDDVEARDRDETVAGEPEPRQRGVQLGIVGSPDQ